MRIGTAWLALALCSSTALAQPSAATTPTAQPVKQRGVFIEDINRKADPCNDFFDYANGAWRTNNPIPDSMVRWSRRWQSGELAKEQLRGILDEVSQRKDWPKASVEQLISDYYGACMDEARVEAQGVKPLQPLLKKIDALKDIAGLQRMLSELHAQRIPVPFGIAAESDFATPTNVIAHIFSNGIGLPDRDYYFKTEPRFADAREKYRAHIATMFKLAGSSEKAAKQAAEVVFKMETAFAEDSLDIVGLRNPANLDHKTTFAGLKKMAPAFDWAGYFRNAKIAEADLNVFEPKFLAEFDRQIKETPLASWKTYLKWHVVRSAAPFLSKALAEESFNFNDKYLGGAKEMKPRWKRCVESTDDLLGEALGRKYAEKYFPPAAKARMQGMVTNLLAGMKDSVEGLAWMGPETKKQALEKLSTFNPKIGYPDKWKDYSQVPVSRDQFWQNVVAGRTFDVVDDRSTLNKPVDRDRWGMTPPTSNAYYNPLLNEIVFPAGILQPPAFSMEATDAVNYGAIGVVIGHEISHGFDDQGAKFDAQGRLKNWWTEQDLKRFEERGQCVVDQFEGYFIEPGIHHNGKLVLGESIGDLAGAKIAYVALQKAMKQQPVPTVDGFTPEQQFFIAWGQFRGDAIRPETQRLMVQSDPHPTGKYRVIGPLSNMPEFQRTFGCKEGAPMVRPAAKRCEVW
ncbi:M13 family metallopeptidase [Hyalangium rubrum]|uniref:M13 family metallopeptidase n=1 Tax=Hyalangium rubrum TaxID=3103134 RepID=A0ABU5HEV6_9BACT|nr:M13 family metallopeptidase [Hyalangium sp. s54d21]MDY7231795.1 M13 family metallopeptidase [Hyalangium sp. s54d21]